MFGCLFFGLLRPMNGMTFNNKEYLAYALACQSSQKFRKHIGLKTLIKNANYFMH
jgi:hypothetical protein